jgi:hypothetical protein
MSTEVNLKDTRVALEPPRITADEQLIAEIFELEPGAWPDGLDVKDNSPTISNTPAETISNETPGSLAPTDEKSVADDSESSLAEARVQASEAGTCERDFWERVVEFDEALGHSNEQAGGARLNHAIALAAGSLSLDSADLGASSSFAHSEHQQGDVRLQGDAHLQSDVRLQGDAHLQSDASTAVPLDGAAQLVQQHELLANRAAAAVAFAKGLDDSAMRAASGKLA